MGDRGLLHKRQILPLKLDDERRGNQSMVSFCSASLTICNQTCSNSIVLEVEFIY